MTKYCIPFFIVFLGSLTTTAQPPSPVFAYGELPGLPDEPSVQNLDYLPQYQVAREIFDQLVKARGDQRYPAPAFVLTRDRNRAAWAAPQRGLIGLELSAYEICSSFGPDSLQALATLLAHEISHYYEKHGLADHFYRQFNDSLARTGKNQEFLLEMEADYLGGFLAYSAGYELFDQMPAFLERLYQAYRFPEKMKGYPTLSERQRLASLTIDRLQQLVDRFEMANCLLAIGDYEGALTYYRSILLEYQSREIYNNAGVAAVLAAFPYFRPEELQFRYPVELDLQARTALRANSDKDSRRKREVLLKEAVRLFDAAISLDGEYAAAFLNKATAYALLGDHDRAYFYAATEAREKANAAGLDKIAADADALLGILDWQQGRKEAARERWRTAAADSYLAAANLRIVEGPPTPATAARPAGNAPYEQIGDLSLSVFSDQLYYDQLYNLNDDLLFAIYEPAEAPGRILFYDYQDGSRQIFFHLTPAGYEGSSARGVHIRSDEEEIQKAYGQPGRRIETPRGFLLVYDQLLFFMNGEGKVDRWAVYCSGGS